MVFSEAIATASAENISTIHLESLALIRRLKDALQHEISMMSIQELSSADSLMSDSVRHIRRHINCLAPVNKLPSEIFARIFQYATVRVVTPNPKASAFQPQHQPASYADLIYVTHVCQTWRNVALATPLLWDSVDDRHRARFEAFRTRAQSVPGLCYELSNGSDPSTMQALRDDGARVRWLNIRVETGADPFSSSVLQFDGSALECVTMHLHSFEVAVPSLFRRKMLPLKALAVHNVTSGWLPPAILRLPNLTHLHLAQVFSARPPAIPMITALLRRTPCVQYLYLGDIRGASPPDLGDVLYTVSLPHLKWFTCVGSDPTTSIHLLSFLRFPSQVSVYMPQHVYLADPELAVYWSLASRDFMVGATRLLLRYSDGFLIVAESSTGGLWLQTRHRGALADPMDPQLWLRRVRSLVPIFSIQVFDFFVKDDTTVRLLADILCDLPCVNALRVQVDPREIAYSTLKDAVRLLLVPKAPGAGLLNCPLLALFCLRLEKDPPDVDALCPAGIIEVLAARAHAGFPVRSFALRAGGERITRDEAEGGMQGWGERVKEAFSGAAAFTEVVDVALYHATPPAFSTSVALWSVPKEAEKYWIAPNYAPLY